MTLSSAWWYIHVYSSIILVLKQLKQEDSHEFKASQSTTLQLAGAGEGAQRDRDREREKDREKQKMAEHLPSTYKALNSIPCNTHTQTSIFLSTQGV